MGMSNGELGLAENDEAETVLFIHLSTGAAGWETGDCTTLARDPSGG